MSWLQSYDLEIPHYDLRDGKFVFALALTQRLPRYSHSPTTSCVTSVHSYSEFRKLWKDLERATRTPNALAAATAALSNDNNKPPRRLRRSRSSTSSNSSTSSTASLTSSSSFRASLRLSNSSMTSIPPLTPNDTESTTEPTTLSAASGCLCSNFCCPFERLHGFIKTYNFPSKFMIKKSTQALLDARRSALELFLVRLRAQFDQFPLSLLDRVEASERCAVLELLAQFVGPNSYVHPSTAPTQHSFTAVEPCRSVDVPLNPDSKPATSEVVPSYSNNIDDEIEAADQPVDLEEASKEPCSPTADSETSNTFVFVPQLPTWPEETIDEDGQYEDESLGETMPIELDEDDIEKCEEPRAPEVTTAPSASVIPNAYRERSASTTTERPGSPRQFAQPALLAPKPKAHQNLPKLQIKSTNVNPVRSFFEDFHYFFSRSRAESDRDPSIPASRRRTSSRSRRSSSDARLQRPWEYALYMASQTGHVNAVATILRRGISANVVNEEDGLSCLHTACRGGHYGVVSLLIAAGADVNMSDLRGMTPLLSAIHGGDLGLVQKLIEAGADVNKSTTRSVSTVHVAVACQALPILALLLERGARVNSSNTFNGKTPLHIAAELGNYDMCDLLMRHDADTFARTDRGDEASTLAVKMGHYAVAELCRQYQHVAMQRALVGSDCIAALRRTVPCCPVYTSTGDVDLDNHGDHLVDASDCGMTVPTVTFIHEGGHKYAVL